MQIKANMFLSFFESGSHVSSITYASGRFGEHTMIEGCVNNETYSRNFVKDIISKDCTFVGEIISN